MKTKDKPQAKQYVIYSRKSKFTGKGESIENQIELCRFLAKVHGDVLAAQLDLVLDTLALAGEFGLTGVDDILLRRISRFHGGTSRYSLGW